MFARIKKSGAHQYLQIVENRRDNGKISQRVIGTVGRLDQLHAKDRVETLIRSLARYSEKTLLVLSGKSTPDAHSQKIGPALIFERIWKELGIDAIIRRQVKDRKFEFDVERAVFLTVLHRMFVSGSDRFCDKWRRDYKIHGVDDLSLHHLYRAMAFLGEEVADQKDATPFAPRCTKDVIEEEMFHKRRSLFSSIDLVFFDTTSLYFEGAGGNTLGQRGHSKDHRPDLNQMIVSTVLDDEGNPLCSEMWPGNIADVTTLIPVVNRVKNRFPIQRFCVVADRGMINAQTTDTLDEENIPYILGARMRQVKEIKEDVLVRAGRYKEVRPVGKTSHDPAPLKVKEVWVNDTRYIVCFNPKQARKDAADRQAIVESLKKQLQKGPKQMIGNKGYRKYLKISRGSVTIDRNKIDAESRFDGKWVLKTNTDLPPEQVAFKYKELWRVEQVFRDLKSTLETRPVFHQRDETITGHVFCSFLALALRKELDRRLEKAGFGFEWTDIKLDLKALQETVIEDNGQRLAVRSQCLGTAGKVFKAVGVALPPTIREL
jgi:transposase